MKHVVLIPGLGADERLFSFIRLPPCTSQFIYWKVPSPTDTFESYIGELKKQIDSKVPPVLIGVSLGGIIAMELRERMPVEKTILISSVKTKSEMPGYFNLIRNLRLNSLIPPSVLKKLAPLVRRFIADPRNPETMKIFKAMIRDSDNQFIHRAIEFVLKWNRQDYVKKNLVHLHGTADFVFPFRNIREPDFRIEGGTHDMVMSKAEEISRILLRELE